MEAMTSYFNGQGFVARALTTLGLRNWDWKNGLSPLVNLLNLLRKIQFKFYRNFTENIFLLLNSVNSESVLKLHSLNRCQ